MKIFISQPMDGKREEEILAERKRVCQWAESYFGEDTIVLPNIFENDLMPLLSLGESIEMLADANKAVFCPGWGQARRCLIEHAVCALYKVDSMEIVYDKNRIWPLMK